MVLARFCIDQKSTLEQAISRLNLQGTQILLVVDESLRLLGTVTDGDIRRALLRGQAHDSEVASLMNRHPITATPDWHPQQAQAVMRAKRIHHVPVVDANGMVSGVFTEESLISEQELQNTAVLMVGGLGKRLGDLTQNCPKPMLKIGGKPILETSVEILRDAGIRNFVFAVNYLAEQIEDYFGDGSSFGIDIAYVQENEPLGTAGALRHIEVLANAPLLVMNGDILTRVNIGHLLRYHAQNDACATMCVREFNHQIPFGVVELDGVDIKTIREKPTSRFFVNSGIYVLNPESLHYLPSTGAFDMPSLFTVLREQQKTTIAYPIQEYWADIGQPQDFADAEQVYAGIFEARL